MIQLTYEPINLEHLLAALHSPLAGAAVLFVGTTRALTGEIETTHLEYECYVEMAQAKLAELEGEAAARWPLEGCAIVHRLGRVAVGEASVAVAVSSPHRRDSFAAAEWLIDSIKQVVPIWKQEYGPDGTSQWIHPGLEPQRKP